MKIGHPSTRDMRGKYSEINDGFNDVSLKPILYIPKCVQRNVASNVLTAL